MYSMLREARKLLFTSTEKAKVSKIKLVSSILVWRELDIDTRWHSAVLLAAAISQGTRKIQTTKRFLLRWGTFFEKGYLQALHKLSFPSQKKTLWNKCGYDCYFP